MSDGVVTVIDTGVANTASVVAAFGRCGRRCEVTHDRRAADQADLLVLPGVGSFGAGMERLVQVELISSLRERIEARRPTLAVCLGMQLLCRESDESPGVEGLGIVDARIEAFPESVRHPQFGWNLVSVEPGCGLIREGHAYFANSYRLERAPAGWSAAQADHGGTFVAAMESGPVLACQFHPELSGRWGLDLLKRWLARAPEGAPC